MGFIILEGLDRSGKSTVAEHYKKRGYIVHHMSAPDKKYFNPGYTGPSYCDELLDVYMKYDGEDVIFDRSPYGECIWPYVFGRNPKLTDEEIEVLREFESKNATRYILMYDSNVDAHWKRCVANKENLKRSQFVQAVALYDKMAIKYGFKKRQMKDFIKSKKIVSKKTTKEKIDEPVVSLKPSKSAQQLKLEQANAINTLLSARIIKRKGEAYDALENSIREFLQEKLGALFGSSSDKNFTEREVETLKLFCQRMFNKTEETR